MVQPKRKEKEKERAEPAPAEAPPDAPRPWEPPQKLGRRGMIAVAAVVLAINLPVIHHFLRGEQPATVQLPYSDDFSDPATVGAHYWTNGGYSRVLNGELLSPGVRNDPLWLEAKLPQDVAVEFDVHSESPEGDVKCEIFGDGLNHASGYVLIHGGWNNRLSIIARLDEHGASLSSLEQEARRRANELGLNTTDPVATGVFRKDTRMRVEANPYPVTPGQKYHWRIERRGGLIRWSIDGKPFMEFDDPFPLAGKGHDRFGFSSWDADLYFDNLRITPL